MDHIHVLFFVIQIDTPVQSQEQSYLRVCSNIEREINSESCASELMQLLKVSNVILCNVYLSANNTCSTPP